MSGADQENELSRASRASFGRLMQKSVRGGVSEQRRMDDMVDQLDSVLDRPNHAKVLDWILRYAPLYNMSERNGIDPRTEDVGQYFSEARYRVFEERDADLDMSSDRVARVAVSNFLRDIRQGSGVYVPHLHQAYDSYVEALGAELGVPREALDL